MTTTRISSILILVLLALFTISCGGGAKQAEESEAVTKEDAFKSVTKYPLPTAFEVTKMLNKAGASYILSLNNPVENVDKYFTEKSKALNLGVYGANLSYASTYQMKQETMSYLKVSKKLIDELQISTAFNAKFAERIESNIDNKDSLIHIISDSFYDTYDFLIKNGKDNISLLVMAGSWTEGLYITTQIAIVSKNNEDFLKIIANQKDPLNKLMELMEPATSDSTIAEVKGMLAPLVSVFEKIEGEKLTVVQLEEITEIVSKIRAAII
jgi:hypothetical protein